MRRLLDRLNALLALGIVGYAVWAWPRLPERIPAHFGPDGAPDRWTDTTLASWFFLPVVAVACWALVLGGREWMVRRPRTMNLPSGQSLEDFPEEVRPAILEYMRGFMALVGLELLTIFGLIVLGSHRTAMGGDGQGYILAVLALAVLSGPVLLVTFFLGFQRVTRNAGP